MKPKWIITIAAIALGLAISATCWGQLKITEIMANPIDDRDVGGEYVEILNVGLREYRVDGCIVGDNYDTDVIVPWDDGVNGKILDPEAITGESSLLPGEFGLILDPDYVNVQLEVGYDFLEPVKIFTVLDSAIGNGLANSGDIVRLWDPAKIPIDEAISPPQSYDGLSAQKVPSTGELFYWTVSYKPSTELEDFQKSPGIATNYSYDELVQILDIANTWTFEQLDEILDVRAAENIVKMRPFKTILELDAVPYVARTAFEKFFELVTGMPIETGLRVAPKKVKVGSNGVVTMFLELPAETNVELCDLASGLVNNEPAEVQVITGEGSKEVIFKLDRALLTDGSVEASILCEEGRYVGTGQFEMIP